MALLDVSDLLTDPDLVDIGAVTVYRQSVTANNKGRGVATQAAFTITASVQSMGADTLNRIPEGQISTGAITLFTTTPLLVASGDIIADELVWQGRRYIVSLVDDWSNYGNGYTAVHCTLKPPNP